MRVLQICNKPPYPPIDGGCIAMNNITEGLLELDVDLEVISVSTNKHPVILQMLPESYIKNTKFEHVKINTDIRLKDAFVNLFSSESYNIKRFISKDFKELIIKRLEAQDFDIILLESLYVTPYIDLIRKHSNARIVLRAHNIEHTIWERMSFNTSNPIKKRYLKLLTDRLKKYETEVISKLDAIVSISELDKSALINLGFEKSILNLPVGYSMKNPSLNEQFEKNSIFHIASMDWAPNEEAVKWFLEKVWSNLSGEFPMTKLYLAGRSMPKWLLNIDQENVEVVGEVASAKNFILSKDIMIVPLLSGSGMRVKIIEGMALGKTIITTSIGAEGINYTDGKDILIANTSEEFAYQISKCLLDESFKDSIGLNAQRLIAKEYSNLELSKKLCSFFEKQIEFNSNNTSALS